MHYLRWLRAVPPLAAIAFAAMAAACTSTGSLTPAAQSDIAQALAIACPVEAAVHSKIPTDADSQAADSLLVSVCPPNPPPTNAVVAALDILNAYEVLKPLVK